MSAELECTDDRPHRWSATGRHFVCDYGCGTNYVEWTYRASEFVMGRT